MFFIIHGSDSRATKLKHMKSIIHIYLLIGFTIMANAQNPINNHLIAYWDFDKNNLNGTATTDYQAHLHHQTQQVPSLNGKGLTFNGKSHAKIAQGLNLYSHFSIAFWIKPTDIQQHQALFYQAKINNDDEVERFIEIGIKDGAIYFRNDDGSGEATDARVQKSTAYLQANQWLFVAFTYDGCQLQLYANCTPILQSSIISMNIRESQTADHIYLGMGKYDQYYYTGMMDEVMVYDKAIEPATIQMLCQGQFPTSLAPPPLPDTPTVVLGQDSLFLTQNTRFFENTTIIQDSIVVPTKNITLKIWDSDKRDNDRIALISDNGKILLKNYTLRKRKKVIPLKIDPKRTNYLFFHALNTGEIALNTCAIDIYVGKEKIGSYRFSSERGDNGALKIVYRGMRSVFVK